MNNSFVHVEYPTHHAAIARYEGVVGSVKSIRQSLSKFGGLAAMLLAAMVSALLVVADQLIDSWVEGHLLAAWVLLWAIGFAAVALLAPIARGVAKRVMSGLDTWSQRIARQRADDRLWAMAQNDPRIMADLRVAKTRAEPIESEPVQKKPQGQSGESIRPACYVSYM